MKLLTPTGWKNLNEETEQIDEISKAKAAAYIPKAAKDMSKKYHGMKLAYDDDGNFGNWGDNKDTFDPEEGEKLERKVKNRRKGISRAVSRLAKEETEQIDEIGDTPRGEKQLRRLAQRKARQLVEPKPSSEHPNADAEGARNHETLARAMDRLHKKDPNYAKNHRIYYNADKKTLMPTTRYIGKAPGKGTMSAMYEEVDYGAFLEHVVMNYPELVEEFLNKDDE